MERKSHSYEFYPETKASKALDYIDQTSPDGSFRILSAKNYLKRLTDLLSGGVSSFRTQTMTLAHDPTMDTLFTAMKAAAHQGATVELLADYFHKMVIDGQIIALPGRSQQKRFLHHRAEMTELVLQQLTAAGASATVINVPHRWYNRLFPPTHRNHGKLSLVQDEFSAIGFLGGVNLTDADLQKENLMAEIHNPTLIAGIEEFFYRSQRGMYSGNEVLTETEDSSLLMDNGSGTSHILSHAYSSIDTAQKNIYLTSQFAIDKEMAAHVTQAAKRNVTVSVIESDPQFLTRRTSWLFDQYHRRTVRPAGITRYSFPGWLHTKLLVVDANTSDATAIFGSHNFSREGAKWQNQELVLSTRNPQYTSLFSRYCEDLTRFSSDYHSP